MYSVFIFSNCDYFIYKNICCLSFTLTQIQNQVTFSFSKNRFRFHASFLMECQLNFQTKINILINQRPQTYSLKSIFQIDYFSRIILLQNRIIELNTEFRLYIFFFTTLNFVKNGFDNFISLSIVCNLWIQYNYIQSKLCASTQRNFS